MPDVSLSPENTMIQTKTLLQQKEEEVANLRETALRQVESQLHAKNTEFQVLSSQFERLKQDFQYNLGLLKDRDEELERYDSEHAVLTASFNEKEIQLKEMHKIHANILSELRVERSKYNEYEFLNQARCAELQHQVEAERSSHAEALIKHHEQCEGEKRALQRALAEVQEELQRQQREMVVNFQVQIQQLESNCRIEVENAKQEAETARQLASQREDETKVARLGESEQLAIAQAALAQEHEKDKIVTALSWELDHMRRLKEEQISDLSSQLTTLRQLSKAAAQESDIQITNLSSQLLSAQHKVEELSQGSASSLARHQKQAREELVVLSVKLEQSLACNRELTNDILELQSNLRMIRVDTQDKVEELEQDKPKRQQLPDEIVTTELRLVKETSEMALSDYEQRREVEIRDLKEQIWSYQQESRSLKEKSEGLLKTLEERRADIKGLKDCLAACGDRERELQRKLLAVELKLDQQAEAHQDALDTHENDLVKRLTEQRDAANSALQDAQSRLLDKETENGKLRDQMRDFKNQSSPIRRAGQQQQGAADVSFRSNAIATSDGSDGLSTKRMRGGRAQQLSVTVPNETQSSMDSLPDFSQLQAMALPSPSTFMLPESAPSPTAWLGGGPVMGGGPVFHMTAAAAAVAAARAEQYLRTSKEGLEELLRPLASVAALTGATDSPQLSLNMSPGEDQLRGALRDLEDQNHRLRSTLTVMREEMETLQTAALAASSTPVPPQDVAVLQAELKESDRDVALALEHIAVLQRQLTVTGEINTKDSQDTDPERTPALLSELPFLRQRVAQLSLENRGLRRQAVQLRLSGQQQQKQVVREQLAGAPGPVQRSEGAFEPSYAYNGLQDPLLQPVYSVASVLKGLDPSTETVKPSLEKVIQELAEARLKLTQLQEENGRLMEMSNALRAERDMLMATTLANWGGRSSMTPQRPAGTHPALVSRVGGSEGSWPAAVSPTVMPSSTLNDTFNIGLLLPSSVDPGRPQVSDVPTTSHDSHQNILSKQQLSPTKPPSLSPLPASHIESHFEPIGGNIQPSQKAAAAAATSLSSDQIFVQEGRETVASPSYHQDRHNHFFSDSTLMRSRVPLGVVGSSTPDLSAAAAAVAVARAQHYASSSGLSPNVARAQTDRDMTQQSIDFDGGLDVAGIALGFRPPSAVPGSASSRETDSQRARLKALQNQVAKPKVRNYSIKPREEE